MATRTLLLLLMTVSFGCRSQQKTPPPQQTGAASPAAANSTPLEMRVGWVTGSCVAMANDSITAGSPITVVSLDDKSSIVDGRITGRATSDATCPALLQDRRKQNEARWSFYELKLSAAVDLGIGVTGNVTSVQGGIDLTGDGLPEKFTQCATSEGVSFRIWAGTPYQGMPLWSGYYYLGYDAASNCPS
jgi:hypothetical protein